MCRCPVGFCGMGIIDSSYSDIAVPGVAAMVV